MEGKTRGVVNEINKSVGKLNTAGLWNAANTMKYGNFEARRSVSSLADEEACGIYLPKPNPKTTEETQQRNPYLREKWEKAGRSLRSFLTTHKRSAV